MKYWLLKSEPETYSIDDLSVEKECLWDGVRNHVAKKNLQAMGVGDLGVFYHSSCPKPGVTGIVRVVKLAEPDPTQFDPNSKYYFPKATLEKPMWFCPTLRFEIKFCTPSLRVSWRGSKELGDLWTRSKARVSVLEITKEEYEAINR